MVHADAAVGDGEGAGIPVGGDQDFQVCIRVEQVGLLLGQEAPLVAGVRGVGDQLAQEDFALGIQRGCHEVQQAGGFGLKAMGLSGHGRSRHWSGVGWRKLG